MPSNSGSNKLPNAFTDAADIVSNNLSVRFPYFDDDRLPNMVSDTSPCNPSDAVPDTSSNVAHNCGYLCVRDVCVGINCGIKMRALVGQKANSCSAIGSESSPDHDLG